MIECGFYHGDCMDYLPDMPDKSIDLAICDPPYGINVGQASMGMGGAKLHTATGLRAGRRKQGLHPIRRQAQPEMGGRESAVQSPSVRVGGDSLSVPKSTRRLTTAARQTPHISTNCGEYQKK